MVLLELHVSQPLAYMYTTLKTVNRLACKQLRLNHVVPECIKGGINLYIELKRHKLDQIGSRNM